MAVAFRNCVYIKNVTWVHSLTQRLKEWPQKASLKGHAPHLRGTRTFCAPARKSLIYISFDTGTLK